MIRFLVLFGTIGLLSACGNGQGLTSDTANFLEGGGWRVESSPYNLAPGSTLAVCDTENTGKSDLIVEAVKIWLDAGGRDDRLKVIKTCVGDRVIRLHKLLADVDFYGRAHPMLGNVNHVDVPRQWAGHWTANHEVGHIFGFGHIFNHRVSIMNSEENGKYMNGGELSAYDRSEVKRMLGLSPFTRVNSLWASPIPRDNFPILPTLRPDSSAALSGSAPSPIAPVASSRQLSCLGANRVTRYAHGTLTSYQGNSYSCRDGVWIFSAGIRAHGAGGV